jgi:hypothetical protein
MRKYQKILFSFFFHSKPQKNEDDGNDEDDVFKMGENLLSLQTQEILLQGTD